MRVANHTKELICKEVTQSRIMSAAALIQCKATLGQLVSVEIRFNMHSCLPRSMCPAQRCPLVYSHVRALRYQ